MIWTFASYHEELLTQLKFSITTWNHSSSSKYIKTSSYVTGHGHMKRVRKSVKNMTYAYNVYRNVTLLGRRPNKDVGWLELLNRLPTFLHRSCLNIALAVMAGSGKRTLHSSARSSEATVSIFLWRWLKKHFSLILEQEYFILHICVCRSLSPHTYDNQTNKITTYIIPCFPWQGLGVLWSYTLVTFTYIKTLTARTFPRKFHSRNTGISKRT